MTTKEIRERLLEEFEETLIVVKKHGVLGARMIAGYPIAIEEVPDGWVFAFTLSKEDFFLSELGTQYLAAFGVKGESKAWGFTGVYKHAHLLKGLACIQGLIYGLYQLQMFLRIQIEDASGKLDSEAKAGEAVERLFAEKRKEDDAK